MATRPNFSGKWQVYKSENFEDFLAANGVNWFIRKVASLGSPQYDIKHDGDQLEILVVIGPKSRVEKFTVGQAYVQEQHSGDMTNAIANWEGDKLVISYEPLDGKHPKPQKMVREMKDGELVMTMLIDDVEAKRYLKKSE